jgi:glycogen(starch) synthase
MRVLLVSYAFAPSIGGVETASQILADELSRRGHEVAVVTATDGSGAGAQAFPVHYQPSAGTLLQLHRWADVVVHNSMTLRFAWPLLVHRKPWVIVHTAFRPYKRLHHLALRRAHNVAVSHSLAAHLGGGMAVIPNAYRSDLFRQLPGRTVAFEFGFLGRLVSDKGAHHLIAALALLRDQGFTSKLAIIGSGEEEVRLRAQTRTLGLEEQVSFLGARRDEALVEALNGIDCLVAPTSVPEGFGIVALEGIACGCVVIGTETGGLKDAIGPCGLTYPNGDVPALAAAMRRILEEPGLKSALRAEAAGHLARHTPQAVVDDYLQVIDKALGHTSAGKVG